MLYGIVICVIAAFPMALLGIIPQSIVADVSEADGIITGENREGMFFAARTFAMKMGQAISMVVYTSITATALTTFKNNTQVPYRIAAGTATAFCLIGALLFLLYNEKDIMNKIKSHKEEK